MTNNKEFWKTVKRFLSDKVTTFPKISLLEKEEIISAESKVANSFSNFFENAKRSLGIRRIMILKIQLKLLLRNLSSTQV